MEQRKQVSPWGQNGFMNRMANDASFNLSDRLAMAPQDYPSVGGVAPQAPEGLSPLAPPHVPDGQAPQMSSFPNYTGHRDGFTYVPMLARYVPNSEINPAYLNAPQLSPDQADPGYSMPGQAPTGMPANFQPNPNSSLDTAFIAPRPRKQEAYTGPIPDSTPEMEARVMRRVKYLERTRPSAPQLSKLKAWQKQWNKEK